jgi:hypothetical protein
MEKAIQNIVNHEDSLCVLTSGGLLSVFRKNKLKDGTKVIELLNTVHKQCVYLFFKPLNKSIPFLLSGENKREISINSTDVVE